MSKIIISCKNQEKRKTQENSRKRYILPAFIAVFYRKSRKNLHFHQKLKEIQKIKENQEFSQKHQKYEKNSRK